MIKPDSIRTLKDKLNYSIKGQEEYTDFLSLLGYKISLLDSDRISKELLPIPLIIGPSGSGKTFGIKTLCKIIDIPLYIADGSSVTKAGYKGNDICELLSAILKDNDPLSPCICLIDEIDKCAEDYENGAKTKGVIYSDFLKILEEKSITSKHGIIDTTNVIFVFGGSFDRINRIKKEQKKEQNIGDIFGFSKSEDFTSHISREELYKFGLNYEFLGRITNIIETKRLSKKNIREIISMEQNPFFQNLSAFLFDEGISEINIDDSVFDMVMSKIDNSSLNTGVRNANSIMNSLIFDNVLKSIESQNINMSSINVYVKNNNIKIKILQHESLKKEIGEINV